YRQADYEASADYIQQAIVELKKDSVRAKEFLPLFEINLANSLVKQGKYELADRYYANVLNQIKNNNYATASALQHYGYSQLQQGQTERAIQLLETAEILIYDNKFYNLRSDLLGDLAEAYETRGDYQRAYAKLNELKTVEDSVFTTEKTQALADALQKYETDKKNQQIELLSSQNELKDLKLLQNQRERWALLGGLLALGMIAGLIYRNNRLRARTNAELELKNATINKALAEKNLLLKEIHHRVKNNLQVISSLLRLQSRYIDDETALEAIQESQNRVRSMSLLHQNLYQDDRLTDVEVQTYFTQLLDELFQSYQVNQEQITIVKNIDPLQLDVDTVIPLGLIVNELITNALKYAFAEAEAGTIEVNLQQKADGLLLRVRDNGIGVDPEVFQNSRSFGNRMIRAFVAKLEGELTIRNEGGTIVEMVIA
ncbi:MAG: histidine kinase dimerization/phosphoacceptor domain -containing protein, partial [Saprospiraceae bacterium]